MGDLTGDQKEQIRKLVNKELSPEESHKLGNDFTDDQLEEARSEVISRVFHLPEVALGIVVVLMLVGLFFALN